MDRLTFIGQTYQGTMISIDDVIKFFDHTMAAYEVVGDVQDATVHGVPDSIHSSLSVQVESPDASKLANVVSYINDTIHNRKDIYGRSFEIDAKTDGNTVELFVRENLYV